MVEAVNLVAHRKRARAYAKEGKKMNALSILLPACMSSSSMAPLDWNLSPKIRAPPQIMVHTRLDEGEDFFELKFQFKCNKKRQLMIDVTLL